MKWVNENVGELIQKQLMFIYKRLVLEAWQSGWLHIFRLSVCIAFYQAMTYQKKEADHA